MQAIRELRTAAEVVWYRPAALHHILAEHTHFPDGVNQQALGKALLLA